MLSFNLHIIATNMTVSWSSVYAPLGLVLTQPLMAECVCVCVFGNVNQEAEWKSHPAVIMKNGSVFILKWGVITGLSLWGRVRDERMRRRETEQERRATREMEPNVHPLYEERGVLAAMA